jgi:hypothetical protein
MEYTMTQIHQTPAPDITTGARSGASSPQTTGEPASLTGYRRGFDVAYAWLSGVFLLAILAQIFLAGLGAFHRHGTPGVGFGPHEDLGNALGIAACVLLVLALVARPSWRIVVCALVLAVLSEVAQHGLAQFGKDNQWVGAVHALDGMFILLLATGLAFTSIRRVRRTFGAQ